MLWSYVGLWFLIARGVGKPQANCVIFGWSSCVLNPSVYVSIICIEPIEKVGATWTQWSTIDFSRSYACSWVEITWHRQHGWHLNRTYIYRYIYYMENLPRLVFWWYWPSGWHLAMLYGLPVNQPSPTHCQGSFDRPRKRLRPARPGGYQYFWGRVWKSSFAYSNGYSYGPVMDLKFMACLCKAVSFPFSAE